MLLAALLVALQDPAPAAVAPRALGWDDFPVFVWRETYAGRPLPEELAEPFGGVILMREEGSLWARRRRLAYLVWNVAGRDALHLDADEAWEKRVEDWIRTQDPKLLVREPCLNDPATVAKLHATLGATIAKHGEHPGLGFVLGDEVSLTPNGDPFDLCRCGLCEAKWQEYARKQGLPECAPLTDEVRLGLLEDDFSKVGPWLARRRFDQEQVLAVLQGLIAADTVSSPSCTLPGPYLGLLGCSGQTAFGGVALERVMGQLGLIECYPLGDARELVATFPGVWRHALDFSSGPDLQPHSLTTLFLRDESASGLAWQVFDTWIRGGIGIVLWSDAELATLPDAARLRLSEAITTVREIEWHFPDNAEPHPLRFSTRSDTVAVVRDADSTALSFLRDARLDGPTWPRRKASYQRTHGRLERKVDAWLRLLEDCGFHPGSIPLASVGAGCERAFGLLVLPEVLVIGDDDVDRLAAYVDAGGTLVIDGTLAWVTREGLPHSSGEVRERLARSHPERVLEAPGSIADYCLVRLDRERAEAARRFVRELPMFRHPFWEPHAGFPRLSGAAADVPWYTVVFQEYPDEIGLALLPNLATREERQRALRDLPLEGITAPDGFTLQWIHPPEGKTLRAGDAAVLRSYKMSR
jgi:hypothetical protein